MWIRQVIAVAALVNGLIATYLHLWKIGKVGTLSCASGAGCQTAQFSSYGWFLGIDTAMWGVVGYTLILVVAVIGTLPRHADARWVSRSLGALVAYGALFTIRLKYGEWVVLRTFCIWCLPSALTMAAFSALAWADARRTARVAVHAS
ncbi:MAG: vitamin K epoxide reductase family protein [Gemmatimonadales bacterium]|nr:vitamin K epoxide reductase family protein [Gemmatimonadales bacterium]